MPATSRRATDMWSSATAVTGRIPNTNRFSRDTTEYPQPTPRNADSATHPVTPPPKAVSVKSRKKQTTAVDSTPSSPAVAESSQQAASSTPTSQQAGPTQSSPSPLSSQSAAGPKSCTMSAATPSHADIKWAIHPLGDKFTSPVWKYLKFNKNFELYALCDLCKPTQWIKRSASKETTSLMRHLRKVHEVLLDVQTEPRYVLFMEH